MQKLKEFLQHPLAEVSSEEENDTLQTWPQRKPTIYEAVVGKVFQWGFVHPSSSTDPSNPTTKGPLRSDEVLFNSIDAPTRYEENDLYFAHARLADAHKLPSGDLLSALHTYISNYYMMTTKDGDGSAWECMDETALIALGILMEETLREALGETGYLALLEGDEEGGQAAPTKL